MLKLLRVLWEYVCNRGYIKFSRISLHELEHALPEQILPGQVDALRKVINFLIFIKLLDISSLDIPGPKDVPLRAIIK